MTQLANLRHERFARCRAQGLVLEDAYGRAGYVPDRSHASRLAARKAVRDRILELRRDHTDGVMAELPRMIGMLMTLAAESRAMGTVQGMRQARLALLDAARLQAELDLRREGASAPPPHRVPPRV